jgi:hypothetical protein
MSLDPDELAWLKRVWEVAPEPVRERARIAHDKLFATRASETDACVECFQHQASEEPCQSCAVIAEAILAERERCAGLCETRCKNRVTGVVLAGLIRGGSEP